PKGSRGAGRVSEWTSERLEEVDLHQDRVPVLRGAAAESAQLAAEVETTGSRGEVRLRFVCVDEVDRRTEPPLPAQDEVDVESCLPLVELVRGRLVPQRRPQLGKADGVPSRRRVGSQRVTVGDARAKELRVELQGEVRGECISRAHDPAQRARRLRREEIEA